MKVLQINCVYGSGSTGKITRDIHYALQKNGIESYVCYGRGPETKEENVTQVSSNLMSKVRKAVASINGMPYRFTKWTNRKLEKEIARIQPDIVHLQCINGYFTDIYRLLHFMKERKIPTVLSLHGEFMYTGGCGYATDCTQWVEGCKKCGRLRNGLGIVGLDNVKKNYRLMQQAFEGFEDLVIVGVSNWITDRAIRSKITKNAHSMNIYNGIDTAKVFFPREHTQIGEKYGIPEGKKVILTVVPSLLSEEKGGKTIIQIAENHTNEDVVFVIVGANQELENKPKNLILIPYTHGQGELAQIYSLADVFVMASKMDNYPTVCLEANCCGTPVVGFDVGGVAETIFPGMGEVVPYGNTEQLLERCLHWAEKKKDIPSQTISAVLEENSKERMTVEYIALYNKVLATKKRKDQ